MPATLQVKKIPVLFSSLLPSRRRGIILPQGELFLQKTPSISGLFEKNLADRRAVVVNDLIAGRFWGRSKT